jgi:ABC-type oligopeptide transport system substrate-binding subunit
MRKAVKLDAVNYGPTEDRSTAIKRFEAGELDLQQMTCRRRTLCGSAR